MCGDRRRSSLVAWLAALQLVAGCESVLGPSSLEGDWTAHRSDHFTLQVRPGSFADDNAATLIAVLEDQYDASVTRLALGYAGRITGVLFPSAAEAERSADRSGTGYPETESFKAVCTAPLDAALFGLLAHEANHVILWVSLGRAGTSLMREGLPSAVISERRGAAGPSFLYDWTVRNASRLPPITSLADDEAWSGYPQDVAYNTSASFLAYLIDVYGPVPLKRLHGAPSGAFERRFEEAYGRPLNQAEVEWKAFCAARSL